MSRADLIRDVSSDHGTLGVLLVDGEPLAHTMEPPWRDNARGRSCIPAGEYRTVWHRSPRYGECYLVTDVPGRSHILIHSGNVGGDPDQGLHTHTQGCVLLGRRRGELAVRDRRQRAVLVSRPTLRAFTAAMAGETFNLAVQAP